MNSVCIGITLIALDSIYLTLTKSFYNNQIKIIQGSDIKIKPVPLIAIYAILIFALHWFIIKDKRPVSDAVILGLIIYAVFELTNIAIFDKWHMNSVILDTIWGGVLFGLTTAIVYRVC
jgi:uncharacterized membrane protein